MIFDAIDVQVMKGEGWYHAGDLVFRRGTVETFRLCGVSRPEAFRQTCMKAHLARRCTAGQRTRESGRLGSSPAMAEQDITSPHNPRVKQAVRACATAASAMCTGAMLIDGAVELSRAMAAGLPVEQVFARLELAHSETSRRTIEQARLQRRNYGGFPVDF